MLTLGIETSCDETSVALTDRRRVLSNCVTSSLRLHAKFGGVVPEIASRYHVEYINYVLASALRRAKKRLADVELVAVTKGPGLVGALLIGVSAAKALSLALGAPLVGVNHVLAHLYSVFLDHAARPKFPFIGLVVSGGHTSLYLCGDFDDVRLLGQTQDDALGEAYDKVAKILGLGFPGGPVIEKMASGAKGRAEPRFPRAYLEEGSLDFSFSGIKTAVLYYTRGAGRLSKSLIRGICSGFQDAALDVVVDKTLSACERHGVRQVVVGGGVSANNALRQKLFQAARGRGINAYFPDFKFCADNAAMIGLVGEELYRRGARSDLYMGVDSNLKL